MAEIITIDPISDCKTLSQICVARAMDLGYEETMRLQEMTHWSTEISYYLKSDSTLYAYYIFVPRMREVLDNAMMLEDIVLGYSNRDSRVLISPQPIKDITPLIRDNSGVIMTQYSRSSLKHLGLSTMMFKELIAFRVIRKTVELIKQAKGVNIDLDQLPLDDSKTYVLLNDGNTFGVMSLESDELRDLCCKFSIKQLKDIMALIVLDWPSTRDLAPYFIARKEGREKIEYEHPLLENICAETYGIIIYDEQVIQVARELAGYTMEGAGQFCQVIVDGQLEELVEHRDMFVRGCGEKNKISTAKADLIFELCKRFVSHNSNKSRAATKALTAYIMAYLKANYRAEFTAAINLQ